jgi:hypothetical protein
MRNAYRKRRAGHLIAVKLARAPAARWGAISPA